jgi:hypothetical protein
MRPLNLSVSALMLVACSSAPPAPDWKLSAEDSLKRAQAAYLQGRVSKAPVQVHEAELARARSSVHASGKADVLATLELAFCAAQAAALDSKVAGGCAPFEALAAQASAADQSYAQYLRGQAAPAQLDLLSAAHQSVARPSDATAADKALTAIADPLTRLVAASARLQAGKATPATLQIAVDTASDQGWRRPLLAWLGLQIKAAELAGDVASAARLRQRQAVAERP